MFDILQFIEAKRDGLQNEGQNIETFVENFLKGNIKDYQVASWLMAVYMKGMTDEELQSFTKALANSGKRVSFDLKSKVVDKHSTGGVGDKTTLILVPLVASCGVPVAKLSGRGLGFTGGTVDKLESIPGFTMDMSLEDFSCQVDNIGCAIAGHSHDLAPAEALFYELRDVTGTVPSLPLICSSIVSKKMAGGANSFVFDVKYGSGAFMQKIEDARALAQALVSLSQRLGYNSSALLTSMEEPLGKWVGNSMEVYEALQVLRGEGPSDTREVSLRLAGEMLYQGEMAETPEEGYKIASDAISSGRAIEKAIELFSRQGGDVKVISNPSEFLKKGSLSMEIVAEREGYLCEMNTKAIGEGIRRLGGGRAQKEDSIDPEASIEIMAKLGDKVEKGQILLRAFFNDKDKGNEASSYLNSACKIGDKIKKPVLILERIG